MKKQTAATSALDLPRVEVVIPYNDFKYINQIGLFTGQEDPTLGMVQLKTSFILSRLS